MTIEKYINEDGLVGIVFGYGDYQSEKRIFDKEMVKIVIEKDFESYLKRFKSSGWDVEKTRGIFDLYQVKFLKPGTRFKVLLDVGVAGCEKYVLTEEDMFTA